MLAPILEVALEAALPTEEVAEAATPDRLVTEATAEDADAIWLEAAALTEERTPEADALHHQH